MHLVELVHMTPWSWSTHSVLPLKMAPDHTHFTPPALLSSWQYHSRLHCKEIRTFIYYTKKELVSMEMRHGNQSFWTKSMINAHAPLCRIDIKQVATLFGVEEESAQPVNYCTHNAQCSFSLIGSQSRTQWPGIRHFSITITILHTKQISHMCSVQILQCLKAKMTHLARVSLCSEDTRTPKEKNS